MSEAARIAARLRAAIDEGAALFEGVSEERTARRPASGAWCAREVIGHLVDSACNNQRRFILNQQAERLSVDPYEQGHIARVIEHMPDEVLHRPRGPIGAYKLPYLTYQTSESATLRDLVEDYVGHIHHHFKQLRSLLSS